MRGFIRFCRARPAAACVLAMVAMLLAAVLVLPAQPLVVVSTDDAGWRLSSRPAREMVQRGFWARSVAYDDVPFELGALA